MNQVAGGLPSVVRPGPTWRVTSFSAGIGFLAMAGVMVAIGEWYFAPWCLFGSAAGFRYATSRVDLFERYILVRNPIRTVRLDWADIESFDAVPSQSAIAYVVRAKTRSGLVIPLHGSMRWRGEIDDLCAQFESRLT